MKKAEKSIWEIIKTKKKDRTIIEQLNLDHWLYTWIGTPLRILAFPIMLIVKLYKWTYKD